MFNVPVRLIRSLHTKRPGLSYGAGTVLWLLTTLTLLYFLRVFLSVDSGLARMGLMLFGLGVLVVHTAMSVYLSDGWKIRFRKRDHGRENRFIKFLGRFE